jgi:hypothetical protein
VFYDDTNSIVYYLPGTTGWPTFNADSGLNPAVLWDPQAKNDSSFGVQNNQFGFNIRGGTNLVIVVEACTNLANPLWTPVSTITLTGGLSYFSDPQWTNYPNRFYRLRRVFRIDLQFINSKSDRFKTWCFCFLTDR